MRLWELASVCRAEPHLMDRLSANPGWVVYLDWYRNIDRLVRAQDRAKLDAELPDAAAIHVLSLDPRVSRVAGLSVAL